MDEEKWIISEHKLLNQKFGGDVKKLELVPKHVKENSITAGFQMFSSFLLAGYGMVAASLMLDQVQHWTVFQEVSELYILIPSLLGLKGNLEMTLASRLSTQAHLGHLDSSFSKQLVENLCLIQCQAVIVGSFAAVSALTMGWLVNGQFQSKHAMVICASSMLTSSLASFILGLVTIGIIVVSRKVNVNPDNVALPITASLGDITTLALLASTTSLLYTSTDASKLTPTVIMMLAATLVPSCGAVAWRNTHTKQALIEGWGPVLSSMVISSAGGLILHYTVSSYEGIALFQLVINGVGGDMAAVRASRLSTSLHAGKTEESVLGTTSSLLLAMATPIHLILIFTIAALYGRIVTPIFISLYMSAAMLQVFLLLTVGYYMVIQIWRMGLDPDNTAIPYLTALGDFLGTVFLGVAFYLYYAMV